MANPNSTTYINENVRQIYRPTSPLAHFVPNGYAYDPHTGLVNKVIPTPGDTLWRPQDT